MPPLLDRMPFPDRAAELVVRNERVRVRANQIIVWVSLGRRNLAEQSPAVVPLPAILDTGHNHYLALSERHLVEWAGLRPDALEVRGVTRDRGQRVTLHSATAWVHPNERGSRERLADRPPYLLPARTGIAVYPGGDFPRLPILGLRAVAENDLLLTVDGRRRAATLRTPARWWPFG
jgi:hypothetical protein